MSKISFVQVVLLFALFYSGSVIAITGKIRILRATGLVDKDAGVNEGVSDAYVMVRDASDNTIQGITSIKQGRNVEWNQDIAFDIDSPNNKLRIVVADRDIALDDTDDFLGFVVIPVYPPAVNTYCPSSGWLKATPFTKDLLNGGGATIHGVIYTGRCASGPKITVQVDNVGTFMRSNDAGQTWNAIGSSSDWTKASVLTIGGATAKTRVRFRCQDKGVVGGFIGTVSLLDGKGDVKQFPTLKGFFSNNANWRVVMPPTAVGDLVFTDQGEGAWGDNIDTGIASTIAQWVWDDNTLNTITFEFSFAGLTMGTTAAAIEGPPASDPIDPIDYDNNDYNDFQFQELNDKITENTNQIYYILFAVASFSLIVICLNCYAKSIYNCKQWLWPSYNKLHQFDQSSVSDNV